MKNPNETISVAYFNFGSKNQFDLCKAHIEQFNAILGRFSFQCPELAMSDGLISYPELGHLLRSEWRSRLPTDISILSNELEVYLGQQRLSWSGYSPGANKWLDSIKSRLGHIQQALVPKIAILQFDSDVALGPQGDWHGFALNRINSHVSFVVLSRTYPEIVFHELFHTLGAEDGYQLETSKTLFGCDDCWMQFEPRNGSRLCSKHVSQIKSFLSTR